MSVHMLEKLLWEVTQQPSRAAELKADPDRFLLTYALEAEEAALIKNLDVRGLMAREVNPMLIMRIWSIMKGRDQTAEYLRLLGAAK